METTSQYRVLIADDHSLFRAGLSLLLNKEEDFKVVGETSTGLSTLTDVERLQPDLLLLDISMPGLSGLDAIPTIKKIFPTIKILVLTMHDEPQYLRQALRSGASGYIPKKAADAELLVAMHAVLRGETYIHPAMTSSLIDDLVTNSEPSASKEIWEDLSDREKEVLHLTALGYTGVEIAEKLTLSPKTIETYRARGMKKLGLNTRAGLVRFALNNGLLSFE